MKKSTIAILAIAGLLILVGIIKIPGTYTKAVKYQEEVTSAWGNVEVNYQRRADLIPNLVSTVKGYASHEKEVLLGVTEARAKAGQVSIDASKITPAAVKSYQAAQSGLTQALSKLMVVMEKYPDLKANQNFMQLQAQLEGTENRIAVARQRFNDSVKQYNSYIRGFWQKRFLSWTAEEGEFERKGVFEADKGAENAPKVEF